MQKKIIALAIAGLASTAAFAQSNVTIYGRVDAGFVNTNGNSGGQSNADSRNQLASGVQSGSRIVFKGAEDLGNGLKAIFETEFGINSMESATGTSNATWTNRHSYLGHRRLRYRCCRPSGRRPLRHLRHLRSVRCWYRW